ncbi:hypothetical protein ATEIFO6365_0003055400 [Aspergillus terreus]|uniref:ABC-2 type transporter transmembrane domain-containing protein n=1 Tax=Aspergillus terreus TaxID=33178 RepID=A0A5M3YRX5_ASPTE|nr:hypothetical protein ATETN484_0003049900 [Aspergillus terreus]GFF14488.1 hypothetical protein ATEIFO6365_0003055400 [Aspergillus terreus]
MPRFVVQRAFALADWIGSLFVGILLLFGNFGPDKSSERRALVMLFIVQFYAYAASMAQLVVCAIGEPTLAAMLATLMFGLSFIFNVVMQPPSQLPRFWIFMYRVSRSPTTCCNELETSLFDPPMGQSCQEYLAPYLSKAGGQLYNPSATAGCEYCSMTSADEYLSLREIYWGDRWRNYGIFWCYFVFNIFRAIALYYVFRV